MHSLLHSAMLSTMSLYTNILCLFPQAECLYCVERPFNILVIEEQSCNKHTSTI